ncbi:MAG TPA: DNA polymerase III subunit gamma/tau [Candidatus Saccharimonadales bacterium]|nr:DNA polymerase III subunit gamma/tau [Candidatus Saccharimonadales bacterium]
MGQALYRKYRSKSLAEVLGQEHITKTLSQALKNGQISHAYLFTGPRGVGKTSVARILAHAVNNLPYDSDSEHLDIIEIDAASNRRIDEIRELRQRVNVAPTSAKYKVYIIDEAHMLTKEAFNALLKTLEEPPEHVIFILATTEAHKVPETISSRTQQFKFQTIPNSDLRAGLSDIAKKEKIEIDPQALELVVEAGRGSFRDSISLLDQASSDGKKITSDVVESILGLAPTKAIDEVVEAVSSGSAKDLMDQITKISESGYNIVSVNKQLVGYLRKGLINNSLRMSRSDILSLMQDLIMVPASADPESAFEIALLGPTINNSSGPEVVQTKPDIEAPAEPIEPRTRPIAKKETAIAPTKAKSDISEDTWQQVLGELKERHNTLYGIARLTKAEFSGNSLVLTSQFAFHQGRLAEEKNKKLIADIIKSLTDKDIQIETQVNEKLDKTKSASVEVVDHVSTISNIFGDAEVLE